MKYFTLNKELFYHLNLCQVFDCLRLPCPWWSNQCAHVEILYRLCEGQACTLRQWSRDKAL